MTGYDIALRPTDKCLSDILYQNGYHTAYIGKWHLDEPEKNYCEAPVSGASGWDAYTPPGNKRHHFEYWHAYNAWNEHLHQHYWENTPKKIMAEEWSPIHETNKAMEYIQQVKDEPFALFLAWNPPHTPFEQVPQKYLDLYKDKILHMDNVKEDVFANHTGEQGFLGSGQMQEKTRQYYACVSGLDEQFGRLVKYLKENNLYDDTLILLTADHGEHLGSHGLVGKHTWYEESVNVPMMLRFPPKLQPHSNNSCINTIHLMPTLLSLLDITPLEMHKQNDISKALINKETIQENWGFISGYISRDVFIEAFHKMGVQPTDTGWRAVRDPRWTYVIFRGYMPNQEPELLLYDRQNDPQQRHPYNLLQQPYTAQAWKLHKKLMGHLSKENPGFAIWAEEMLRLRGIGYTED